MTTAEPRKRSRWRRATPWIVSLGVHAAVAAAIAILAVGALTLSRNRDEEKRTVVLADFMDPAPRRSTTANPPPREPTTAAPTPQQPDDDFRRRISDKLRDPALSELDSRLAAKLSAPPASLLGDVSAPAPPVSFVGLTANDVRKIVYVVDASGSMVGSLRTVIDELERSLARLAPEQSFSVLFFQRNGVIALPPAGELRPATADAVRATVAWARERVRPAGRSNPLAALEAALALKPDVVFLLSTAITGSGEFEIARDALLARLDTLNPVDAKGLRRTRIQCVQFLDPDPLDTLLLIARRHGGESGYRYLSRDELGLGPRAPSNPLSSP